MRMYGYLIFYFSFTLLTIYLKASSENSPEVPREGKILPLFTVIKFKNAVCKANSGRNGTCLLESECIAEKGIPSGSCASGYGTCCISLIQCGQSSFRNVTYFTSSGTETRNCVAKICPNCEGICQLRLDFDHFMIAGPSSVTVSSYEILQGSGIAGTGNAAIDVTLKTRCNAESFSVTSPGFTAPPVICGINTGQHMIVSASPSTCNALSFNLGSMPGGSNWQIKITQIECTSPLLAPQGCTKYFYDDPLPCMTTYNYEGGLHLANQRDVMCIRRERNNCAICYTTENLMDFDLTTGDVNGVTVTGSKNMCCGYGTTKGSFSGYDCVIIPGLLQKASFKVISLQANEFCGRLKGIAGVGQTLCTKRLPYKITFMSDDNEIANNEAKVDGKGFRICAFQLPCN